MFIPYIERMHSVCQTLHDHPDSASPMGRLVCAGIEELSARAAEYDAVISKDFPFKKHFLALLTSLHEATSAKNGAAEHDGVVLQLFEDLALFARLRSLKLGQEHISTTERAILQHFESSGQWLKEDDTLVSRHYWYELPMQEQTR